jgi:hypothetical protein
LSSDPVTHKFLCHVRLYRGCRNVAIAAHASDAAVAESDGVLPVVAHGFTAILHRPVVVVLLQYSA